MNHKLLLMEHLHPELRLIIDMFPKQKERINDLYKTDLDFQSLCADYFLCKKTLQEFQRQSGEKQNTVKEYEDMRTDLEQELYDSIFHT